MRDKMYDFLSHPKFLPESENGDEISPLGAIYGSAKDVCDDDDQKNDEMMNIKIMSMKIIDEK